MSMKFTKSQMSIEDKRKMERIEAENKTLKADNIYLSMVTGVDLPSMAAAEEQEAADEVSDR